MDIRIPVIFVLVLGVVACAKDATKSRPTPSTTTAPSPTSTPAPAAASKSAAPAATSKSIAPAAQSNSAPGKAKTQTEQKSSALVVTTSPPATTHLAPVPLNLTPYTSYTELPSDWGSESNYSGRYTRIMIQSERICGDGDRCDLVKGSDSDDYKYQNRSALTRYLFGKQFDFNLSVKITIGEYETTVPLVTVGHESDSKGEVWTRSVSHKLLDYPLFLVKGDGSTSIPTFVVKLTADKTVDSNLASAALQVAIGAIQQVSPTSSVLTKLSTESSKAKSNAIDTAINSLFANGITETHTADIALHSWKDADGIKIDVHIPRNEADWNRELRPIGTWTIKFEPPRPSVFSDWRLCVSDDIYDDATHCDSDFNTVLTNVHNAVTPASILNYPLVNNPGSLGTIQAYITQQDWYTSAMTGLKKNQDTENYKTADTLCLKIENVITGLDLNQYDAEMVVWAIARGLPLPADVTPAVFAGKDAAGNPGACLKAITDVEQYRTDKPNVVAAVPVVPKHAPKHKPPVPAPAPVTKGGRP